VLPQDALRAIEKLGNTGARYTLALIDPPYASGIQTTVLKQVAGQLMAAGGLIVIETSSRFALPEQAGCCTRHDRRVYGDTALDFFITEAMDAP